MINTILYFLIFAIMIIILLLEIKALIISCIFLRQIYFLITFIIYIIVMNYFNCSNVIVDIVKLLLSET